MFSTKVLGEHVDGILNDKERLRRSIARRGKAAAKEVPRDRCRMSTCRRIWRQRRRRKVRGGGGEKGIDGGRVGGVAGGGETGPRVESPAIGSTVIVVLVWKGMVWETGRPGAPEKVFSRETVVGASPGCGRGGANFTVQFRPGGRGGASAEEELCCIVHEGGGGGQRYGVRWS